jgi:hypothetical protein
MFILFSFRELEGMAAEVRTADEAILDASFRYLLGTNPWGEFAARLPNRNRFIWDQRGFAVARQA